MRSLNSANFLGDELVKTIKSIMPSPTNNVATLACVNGNHQQLPAKGFRPRLDNLIGAVSALHQSNSYRVPCTICESLVSLRWYQPSSQSGQLFASSEILCELWIVPIFLDFSRSSERRCLDLSSCKPDHYAVLGNVGMQLAKTRR